MCPNCAGRMSGTPDLAGRTVACVHCQRSFVAPTTEPDDGNPFAVRGLPATQNFLDRFVTRKRSAVEAAFIGAAFGVVTGLVLSVGAIVVMVANAQEAPPHDWAFAYNTQEAFVHGTLLQGIFVVLPFCTTVVTIVCAALSVFANLGLDLYRAVRQT